MGGNGFSDNDSSPWGVTTVGGPAAYNSSQLSRYEKSGQKEILLARNGLFIGKEISWL